MDNLQFAGGELALARPGNAHHSLRAWDAADELLIERARARLRPGDTVAIVDDAFGALTLALADFHPVAVADSAGLAAALVLNGRANDLLPPPVADWRNPPAGPFQVIVLRIPRQLDYLDYLLRWVNQVLASDGVLIAAGMIKHVPDRSAELFSERVQTRQVYPARKKARVIECQPGQVTLAGWDRLWQGYPLPGTDRSVMGLPAVFSRERLDPGASRIIPHVRRLAAALNDRASVLDLACGNGVLGAVAVCAHRSLRLVQADISSQAVVSAGQNLSDSGEAVQWHSDGVPVEAGDFDLILLNPPFHEGGVVGDHIALRLFAEARRHLKPGGQVLVVGNRHLGYHRSLRRHFSAVRQVDADPRFVVFEAGDHQGRSV